MYYTTVLKYQEIQSPDLRKRKALEMWRQFFEVGSQTEINVDSLIKDAISEKINKGQFDSTLFDEATYVVYNLLRFSILPLWKVSPLFKDAMKNAKPFDCLEFVV